MLIYFIIIRNIWQCQWWIVAFFGVFVASTFTRSTCQLLRALFVKSDLLVLLTFKKVLSCAKVKKLELFFLKQYTDCFYCLPIFRSLVYLKITLLCGMKLVILFSSKVGSVSRFTCLWIWLFWKMFHTFIQDIYVYIYITNTHMQTTQTKNNLFREWKMAKAR